MVGILKKWWFWVGLILVIGIAVTNNGGNKEQEAAEALVSQINQFESELAKVKEPEISIIKEFDTRYKAFIDSSNIVAKKESIKPESVTEIKNKLNHIKTSLDSLVSTSLANRMLGSYKGSGQIATCIIQECHQIFDKIRLRLKLSKLKKRMIQLLLDIFKTRLMELNSVRLSGPHLS